MRKIQKMMLWCAGALFMAACSSETDTLPEPVVATGPQTFPMMLVGGIQHFDEEESSAAATRAGTTTTSWEENDSLYVQFQTAAGVVDGVAVFKNGEWSINSFGIITENASTPCRVYHFCNIASTTTSTLRLTAQSAVYADTLATYILEQGVLTVTARLKPLTGRLRFMGTSGQKVTFSGLKWYSGYAFKGALSQQADTLTLTAAADGYTPYVYGTFADEDNHQFTVEINEYVLTRRFGNNVLATGKSGYLNLPTMDNRSGWTLEKNMTRTFTITGNSKTVTFKMVRVEAGSFKMGMAGTTEVATPVHNVTLSKDYFIGEVEVTNALWYAVMGSKPSDQTNSGDTYPVACVSWNQIAGSSGFLDKLNTALSSQLNGKKFRLPTDAEWEFAAKGGNETKGYIYAGSNTIGDVAWYTDNSNGTTHPVGEKKANELGIYDMSGNVWEWCNDCYGDYPTAAQTDPTGPTSGSTRVFRGGGWYFSASHCSVAYRDGFPTTYARNGVGFRLAL